MNYPTQELTVKQLKRIWMKSWLFLALAAITAFLACHFMPIFVEARGETVTGFTHFVFLTCGLTSLFSALYVSAILPNPYRDKIVEDKC